jgi:hypothetical protein
MKYRTLLIGLAITVASSLSAWAGTYEFSPIIYPTDTFTQMLGINSSGEIVGYHGMNINKGLTTSLSNITVFTSENYPNSAQTQVTAINTAGDTAGFYIDNSGFNHGFTDTAGTFATVDAPGTVFNQLLSWNDVGQVAGYSSIDPTGMTLQRAFTLKSGTYTYLTDYFPAGTGNAQATGVNNSGVVCGFYVDSVGVNHGFLLTNGVLTTLNYPNSTSTMALGLNNENQVVGTFADALGNGHGFLYNSQYGIYQQIDDPLAVPPSGTTVNGINNAGDIVGFYVDDIGNTDGFVATPAPACSTVSPSVLNFGTVAVGTTSAPQAVTVTNCASTPTVIVKYLFTAPYVFHQTNTCPVSPNALPSKVSCTLNITFAPTSTESVTSFLQVFPLLPGQLIRMTGN